MEKLEIALTQEYALILDKVSEIMPLATQDIKQFGKSSSQFKTVTLDVTDLTPIHSAKHLLAVIARTKEALEETSINYRRKKLELKRKELQLMSSEGNDIDELLIDIDELKTQLLTSEGYVQGAIRKLANALDQYQSILKSLGKDCLTEYDYEQDQIRYHIKTAFFQALTAARARGGLIDEGNHIYLFQLGINGALAQYEVTELLKAEAEALEQGLSPTHEGTLNWLDNLADKYLQAPKNYAKSRALNLLNKEITLGAEK